MSLVKTLAKVAIGVAIAKGAQSMMQQKSGSGRATSPGSGSVFGSAAERARPRSEGSGGLEDLLGQLGGRASAPRGGGGGGGIGDILGQLGGSSAEGSRGGQGGLQDMLGQVLGGGAQDGGLGGMLEGLSRASRPGEARARKPGKGSIGDLLNQAIGGHEDFQPDQNQEEEAAVMLGALIQATKADGKLDESEKRKILDQFGDLDRNERAFIQRELDGPIDIAGLARKTPRGQEGQVYMMSLLGIDLDNRAEAEYLHQLAGALRLDPTDVNAIHDQMRVPRIYR